MDNLPIPQSRIENLMNAFISRDSSRISAPQSRVEEFWYHLIAGTNSLPIPQSRIELLLKKIIENDTEQIPLAQSRAEEFLVSILTGDINKLPIPQSRSEYYLDYIARNNLVLDDIEYLKYNGTNITATNTVQKPFKSAILKGNTLVNLVNYKGFFDGREINSDNTFKIDATKPFQELIIGKEYTFITYVSQTQVGNISSVAIEFNEKDIGTKKALCVISNPINGVNKVKFTVPSNYGSYLHSYIKTSSIGGSVTVKGMIIEGDLTQEDIPYFTGMQSVKLPVLTTVGKNLFDINNNSRILSGSVDNFQPLIFEGNQVSITSRFTCSLQYLVKLKPNTKYAVTLSERNEHNKGSQFRIARYSPTGSSFTGDWNNLFADIHLNNNKSQSSFVTDATGYIVVVLNPKSGNEFLTSTFYDIQLEEGSTTTTYEPYKSNILTVNEDVTLRSNGDVYDELNLLTGRLTQRIDENNEVLAQEVVKTVDLKVVDQDGNPVKQLSAFDETTHIVSSSASDNSLIAIAEVEVPTKLIEALNAVKSLSSDVEMLINEVDNAQKLQDENSTMVMSAMTELYEMVLVMGGGS